MGRCGAVKKADFGVRLHGFVLTVLGVAVYHRMYFFAYLHNRRAANWFICKFASWDSEPATSIGNVSAK